MKMNDDLRNHWEGLLKPIFPDRSKIKCDRSSSDFRVRVSWKLGNDPERPNKMSKTILVIVPDEVADDYSNKNDAQRNFDDMKLKEFVSSGLSDHDPDPDHAIGQSPPVVEWIAGSNILNS